MNCDSSVVHFSPMDRIAISLAVCSLSYSYHQCSFAMSKLFGNSKPQKRIRNKHTAEWNRKLPNSNYHLFHHRVLCINFALFIGKHDRFEYENHTRMDAWLSTLPWNVQLHCLNTNSLVHSVLNRKMKSLIFLIVRNFIPNWNPSWDLKKCHRA